MTFAVGAIDEFAAVCTQFCVNQRECLGLFAIEDELSLSYCLRVDFRFGLRLLFYPENRIAIQLALEIGIVVVFGRIISFMVFQIPPFLSVRTVCDTRSEERRVGKECR